MSDEAREAIGPFLKMVADDPEVGPEIGQLFKFLAEARGQWQMFAAGTTTGAVMAGGLMNLVTNELNPVILRLIAGNPNNVLSASDAAQAKARRIPGPPTWDVEANKNGIDDNRFNALVEMSRPLLPFLQLLDMLNRGQITSAQARHELERHGWSEENISRILSLRNSVLSPEQLAAMVNRDIVAHDAAAKEAEWSGVNGIDFERMTLLGGDPLSAGDLAVAYRRGFIDEATFKRGIIQGPLRKEWFPTLMKLQYSRMSTVDAADAANQGHMSKEEAAKIAEENGMEPEDFLILLEAAGQPPGIEFADEAYNRGFISDAEYKKMFLESRIKNIYLPLLEKMRTRLIPQETMRVLYRKGVYSIEQITRGLRSHGFSTADTEALIASEHVDANAETRELTRAQVVDLYEEQLFSRDDAITMLTDLGYDDESAQAMIELADLKRLRTFINSAISKVKSAYVTGKVDETFVSASLDALGVPVGQRDSLLYLWDIERTTITKTLTAAQIRQAFNKDLIARDDAMARLIAQGYDELDADLFLQLTA
jgi:SOS response regulatory protein OraA/RecX